MKNIKLFEAYFDNKNLLDEMSKRFFDNQNQLNKFIENIESDPQWIRQPIQSVVNLGYNKWVDEDDFPDYTSMLKWCLKEYGPLPKFLIQFLKYHQFILNDGHLAYYEAGMASSKPQDKSVGLDIHNEMVKSFNDYFIESDLKIENSEKIYKILTSFKISIMKDPDTDVNTVSNIEEIDKLDQEFYDVSVDFMSGLEEFFKEFIRDIKDTLS